MNECYILHEYLKKVDAELAEHIAGNSRRYVQIFSDVIYDLLPDYKSKEVCLKFYLLKINSFIKLSVLVSLLICQYALKTYEEID